MDVHSQLGAFEEGHDDQNIPRDGHANYSKERKEEEKKDKIILEHTMWQILRSLFDYCFTPWTGIIHV